MSRKGENIYKRKDGRWEGRYIKDRLPAGKVIYGYVYGKTYTEVRRKLSESKINDSDNTATLPLYSEIVNSWLAHQKIKVKESTYANYQCICSKHILTGFGNLKINNISTKLLENYIADLSSSGMLSSKSISNIISIIKSTLIYAEYMGYTVNCRTEHLSVRQSRKEMRVLSNAERCILEKYLFENIDLKNLGIILALYTGIRIGELCALQWKSIDTEKEILTISETLQRISNTDNTSNNKTKIIITSPKSLTSFRSIPIPHCLIDILKPFVNEPEVFLLSGNCNPIEPRTMQNRFSKVISECNIKQANFHSLRHTFATRCVELGFDAKTLSEILGHSSVNITLNRYVHSSFDRKQESMNLLSADISGYSPSG